MPGYLRWYQFIIFIVIRKVPSGSLLISLISDTVLVM